LDRGLSKLAISASLAVPTAIPFALFARLIFVEASCPQFGAHIALRGGMHLTRRFAKLLPEKRPQDPHLDGTGLRFETMDHGGEYPDTMPQAIKLIDAEGRS
jgi:hypothetical protein